MNDFKNNVRMNLISNFPVTISDIEISKDIYVQEDMGSLKRKALRKIPTKVKMGFLVVPN